MSGLYFKFYIKKNLFLKFGSLLLLLALIVGVVSMRGRLYRHWDQSPAMRGERIARESGCFACHGAEGSQGIVDPTRANARIPSWEGRELASYASNVGEIRTWITDGVLPRLRKARDPKLRHVPMPAYREHLSTRELDDLVAYIMAVSGFDSTIPDAAYEGRVVATQQGCFGCHGPSGIGGTLNPGSFKGIIPAWDGTDYAELVQNETEFREWILDGHAHRLWDNPIARHFLEGQIVKMPAYRALISDDDLKKLVAYFNWLRHTTQSPSSAAMVTTKQLKVSRSVVDVEPTYLSPQAIVLSHDGKQAYVANQSAGTVSFLNLIEHKIVAEVTVGAFPSGIALSPNGRTLYVSCQHEGHVAVVDIPNRKLLRTDVAGDEPQGLALSPDGARLYVANYLSNTVSILSTTSGQTLSTIEVGRGPRFLALSPNGARLVVSNGLGRSVSIIDPIRARVLETRKLGQASLLRGVTITPDGNWALIAHLVSRDRQIPVQLERGWIHSNGISLLDLRRPGHFVTLLLDKLFSGAANPYDVIVAPDGKRAFVTLAGTQEVALINLSQALRLAEATLPEAKDKLAQDVEIAEQRGIARRVPAGCLGPRSLGFNAKLGELFIACHFSDDVVVLDANTGVQRTTIALGPPKPMSLRRRGEMLFNDARIAYQSWYSCVSCHEEDAGADALNWDLPNDGTGNSKNVKSLHDAYDTAPAMWTGVREDLDAATQAGQRFLGFLPQNENNRALVAYLEHPMRAPNPNRTRNLDMRLRGAQLFDRALCSTCHPGPKYTDQVSHDLGLGTKTDLASRFDTPSLRECYRTAPYLHDGRASTLESIFQEHDPLGLHGRAMRELNSTEQADLIEFVRSL